MPHSQSRPIVFYHFRTRAWAGLPWALGMLLVTPGASAGDPCDFAGSGRSTFSPAQVRACYSQVPFSRDDLENIVAVIAQHRQMSDLAEVYQQRVQWQEALSTLLTRGQKGELADDFSMHEALKREHKRFRNGHVSYRQPVCYWQMLNAFMPFDFGSTVERHGGRFEQLIFIEAARFLPDVYQEATGIDAERYVGMRVVEINGLPVLDYFRDFGRVSLNTHEDDGGHLNAILNYGGYSIRTGGPHDFIPDRASDEYLLENRERRRVRITMPWVFGSGEVLFGDQAVPLSKNSSEFVGRCVAPLEALEEAAGIDLLIRSTHPDQELDYYRGRALDRCSHRYQSGLGRRHHPRSFYEVPPGWLNRNIVEVIPQTGSARVVEFDGRATVLQLRNTRNWIQVARQGIEHACQRSGRLVVDVRRNSGGDDTTIQWLHRHLFPDAPAPDESGKLVSRLRNDQPMLAEFLYNSALWDAFFAPNDSPCQLGLGPGCLVDIATGDNFARDELDWFRAPYIEELRGGAKVTLSREFSIPYAGTPTFDSASCAGQISGKNLVFLTDGSNASGGYFLPAAFKGEGIIVQMGGYLGENLAMGRARGGPTYVASSAGVSAELLHRLSGGAITFQHNPMLFRRQVDSSMETFAAYLKDRSGLHLEQPVEADVRIGVWSDSPETDGFVYARVLEAVDRRGGNP